MCHKIPRMCYWVKKKASALCITFTAFKVSVANRQIGHLQMGMRKREWAWISSDALRHAL